MLYSLLDLAPVPEGATPADALARTRALAQEAEKLGYHRFWLAEHHNMTGIASAATAVLIGHVAGATSRIRVGSGGIMLPNHAPLMVAEAFGTLATLYPGRIDLGVGRAPGTDPLTMRALRRGMAGEDRFPTDVQELIAYLGPPDPEARVRAVPGQGTEVPVYILGSSLYGAQLAAALGLPYAFASHFAPAALEEAFDLYRRTYRPSSAHPQPHAIMAVNVFAAETDEQGQRLATSMMQAFANLRLGRPGPLPHPADDIETVLPASIRAAVGQALSCSAIGSKETVQRQLTHLIKTHAPDEVIVNANIHDTEARLTSVQIAAEILRTL